MSRTRETVTLTMKNRHILTNYVMEKYTTSGLSLPAFAAQAMQDLGFELNRDHVNNILKAFEIPVNERPKAEKLPPKPTLLAMLAEYDRRLSTLERRVDTYIGGGR